MVRRAARALVMLMAMQIDRLDVVHPVVAATRVHVAIHHRHLQLGKVRLPRRQHPPAPLLLTPVLLILLPEVVGLPSRGAGLPQRALIVRAANGD